MSEELIWLNGGVIPLAQARIGVEDRGLLFADAVYEAMRVYGGHVFALDAHLERLERSAEGLRLPLPMSREQLASEIVRFVGRAAPGLRDGVVYLQLTRGPARRDHLFPEPGKVTPTLFFFVRPLPEIVAADEQRGIRLISVPDDRWRKCWIKSTGLMAAALARNEAAERGCDEAVFVDDNGIAAECTSSNLFFVKEGKVVTHPAGARVLPGVTRACVIDCARALEIPVEERPPSVEEAKGADEVFITSTTREVQWVREWDGATVGGGRCGVLTARLHGELRRQVQRDVHIRGSSGASAS